MYFSNQPHLLTPDQLIHKYSQLESLGWNASKIGTFYSSGLLLGVRKQDKAYILENSFKDLIDYYNKLLMKCSIDLEHKRHLDHLTAEELLVKHPDVTAILGWNSSKIGIFFNSGLLRGYRNSKENRALIQELSFEELIRYANRVNRSRNVNL